MVAAAVARWPVTHLRTFWWLYAGACAVQPGLVWGLVLLAAASEVAGRPLYEEVVGLFGKVLTEETFMWTLIALGLPQCVGLVVLLRRPPAELSEGAPRLYGSIALGVVLFAALYNWYVLGALTVLTIGAFPVAWTTFVPFVVLRMTYREVVLGDEAG